MSETTVPNPAPEAVPPAAPQAQAAASKPNPGRPARQDSKGPQGQQGQKRRGGRDGRQGGRGPGGKPARPLHPVLVQLWELHPRVFGASVRPLKLGVFEDLMARHPGAFSKEDLKQAIGQHVRSTRYLEAVALGQARHDLDGQALEPVAPEHVQHAIVEVWRRRQGRDAAAARAWARVRLVHAIEASGLDREAWLERVRTNDASTQELVDEAFAELAGQAARREALVRAYKASGQQDVDAFAEMYGLDAALVRDALARDQTA